MAKKLNRYTYIAAALLTVAIYKTSAESLTITSGEFPPYSGAHLKSQGIASQIVRGAFEQANSEHKLEIEFQPWKRAIASLNKGNAIASYPYFMNESRKQDFYFSEPLYAATALVYGNSSTKDDVEPKIDSLVCLPLGFAMGSMSAVIDKYDLVLVRPNYLVQCFQLLYKQRVEYVFADKDVAEYIVRNKLQPTSEKLYPLPFFNTQSDLHLIVKKSEAGQLLLDQFNKGLKDFKQTKQYQDLMSKVH